nr:zinc finger, CCHC-type, retrotransposon Gag domain protein [Tanacetum cinerariifolium]
MSLMHRWHDTICGGVIGLRRSVWIHPRAGCYNYGIRAARIDLMVRGVTVINPRPSTLGYRDLENRNLNPLALQLLQLMLKTRLLISRNYLKCWDVLMSLKLGWLAISLRVMLLIGGKLSSKPREVKRMWRHCHGRTSMRPYFSNTSRAGPPEEQAKHFKWALSDSILDRIVNTEFTDVAQVANAGRNIELLRERGGVNNKRNFDGDRIQSMNKNNNQRGYGQRGNDGRNYDRQGGNGSQRFYHENRDQQYNRLSGSLRQKKYTDYTSPPPPCDT